MLSVIPQESRVDENAGLIIIESDKGSGGLAYTELDSADCRRLAIKAAAQMGLPDPRINGNVDKFPVTAEGVEVSNPIEQKAASFRAAVPVTRRLV